MKKCIDPNSPTSAVEVWELTDPTSSQNQVEILDQDIISISRKPFSAKRVLVSLANVQLVYHQSTHRVRTRTKVDPRFVVLLIIGKTAQGTIDGIKFRPDAMIMVAPGAVADLIVEPGYKSVSLMMAPTYLRELVREHGGAVAYPIPRKYDFKTCNEQLVQTVFSLCEKVATTAEKSPKLFDQNGSIRSSAETDVLESLISILDTTPEHAVHEAGQTGAPSSYFRIIKAVEAYAMQNLDRPVFVRDFCKVTGVSERTLHVAFRDIMNMPPAAYLRRLRLHRARSALQRGSAATTSVSTVALDWGFWHFGEFSQSYKQCFGELPSSTLKRKYGDKQS